MQRWNNTSLVQSCVNERSHAVFSSWLAVYLLILPVFLAVVYFGCRKWRSPGPRVSHSDVFAFHMVAMELLNLVGSCLFFAGYMLQLVPEVGVGLSLKHLSSVGEMCFHCLTCVERYLAVVQPVTYLRLKRSGGVRCRDASVAGVWLVSAASLALALTDRGVADHLVFGFVVAVLSICLVSFCSVSVLCVLTRPGPGEGGGRRIDQTKRAATCTMLVILGALWLRMVAVGFYYTASLRSGLVVCAVVLCTYWFAMPSSLVLPLLFLHREGVVAGRRKSQSPPVQTLRVEQSHVSTAAPPTAPL